MTDRVLWQNDDTLDEENLQAAAAKQNQSDYVERGLFLAVDYTTPAVDVTAGHAVVANSTGDRAWDVFPDARSGVSLTANAVNSIYLVVDPDVQDAVSVEAEASDTPSDPYLKLGEVDTSADTTSEANRAPSATVESLDADELSVNGSLESVATYGAVGDGSTNDTQAVQDAANASSNGYVFVPANYNCKIHEQIEFPNGVGLWLEGTITAAPDGDLPAGHPWKDSIGSQPDNNRMLAWKNAGGEINAHILGNGVLDGQRTSERNLYGIELEGQYAYVHGITIKNIGREAILPEFTAKNIVIENVTFDGFHHAVNPHGGATDVVVRGCTFRNGRSISLYVEGASSIWLLHNNIRAEGTDGITAFASSVEGTTNNVLIKGNTIVGAKSGVTVNPSDSTITGVAVVHNDISECDGTGIDAIGGGSSSSIVIAWNTLKNNGQDSNLGGSVRSGIRYNAGRGRIFNNECYDDQGTTTQQFGIRVYIGATGRIVTRGNDLHGNATNYADDNGVALATDRPSDVRNVGVPKDGDLAIHNGSGSNTRGPAWYNDTVPEWESVVDGSTIS